MPCRSIFHIHFINVLFLIVKVPQKAPQQPKETVDSGPFSHEVVYDLIGLIKDLRYDLSMQVPSGAFYITFTTSEPAIREI